MLLMLLLRVRQVSGMLMDKREMVQVSISAGGGTSAPVKRGEFSKLFFGSVDYYGSDRRIILHEPNGYKCLGDIDSDLSLRMDRINERGKTINYVQLFGGTNEYFISVSEGTEWNGLGEGIDKELKSGGKDKILDVVIAGDGSWIIVRPNRIITSHGVSTQLTNKLWQFFRKHRQRFVLQAEIAALRDQLLQHPKFKWTEVEREKLVKKGRSPGSIDRLLMPRIVQCCENEVLGMIHRTYYQNHWLVRSNVFDGLIVEPGPNSHLAITEVNRMAESMCRGSGWDIRSLVEKPLHGLQDVLPITIKEARKVIFHRQSID